MKPVTGRSLKFGIFLVLVAILAIIFIVMLESNHVKRAASFVAHTNDVLYQSEQVLSTARKAKVVLRDYMLTADKQQLQILDKTNEAVFATAKKLQTLTADNSSQQVRIDSLVKYIQKNIEFTNRIIAVRQKRGLAEATTAMQKINGNHYSDLTQQVIRQIEDQENILLAAWKDTNQRSGRRLNNMLLALIGIVVVLMIIIIQNVRLDILALRNVEKDKARKQEEITYLSKLVEQTNDAIFSADKNLIIKSWNKAAEKLYGYTEREAIGQHVGKLIRSPFSDKQREKIIAELEKNVFFQTESTYYSKEGKAIFVLISLTSIKSDDGQVTGYVSVHKDISERKKLEDELVKLNTELKEKIQVKSEELTGIFERLTDAFVAFDKNWRYTYANKKAGELLRRPPETLIGKNVWEEFPDAVGSDSYNIFHKALADQQYAFNTDYYGPLDLWQENHVYPSPEGISVFIKDITNQKKAEQEINKFNERFQLVVNATNDAVWDWDLTNHTIWWNRNYYSQFGYTKEESTPVSSRYNGIHPEDRQRITDGINRAVESYQPYWSDEYRFLKADGTSVFVLDRATILYTKNNKPARMIGAMVDVTRIRKAEEKVINNEKRFRALLQNSTDGLTLLDADAAVIDISPSGNKILGYSYNEMIGKIRFDLIHPDDAEEVRRVFNAVIKIPGEIILLEHRHKMPDGSYKWLECSYNNLLEEPYVNAVVLNYRDITERKLAEDKVRTNEQMLSRAQEIGQFGSWEFDAFTNDVKWSDSMYRIHGISKEMTITPDVFFQCLHPDDVKKIKTIFRNLRDKESRFRDEYRFIRNNNNIRFALTTIDTVFENGKFRKAMGVIQDITDLKNTEETLRQSEARYRKAQLQGKLGHWEFDIASKVLFLSDEICSMYNLQRHHPAPASGFDDFIARIHPDDQTLFINEIDAALKGEKNLDVIHRIIREDGTIQYMHEIAELIKSETGRPLRLVGMAQDITDQKLAGEKLRRSEHKYRLLFENNPMPMWMTSIPDLNIIDVNESALKQYGYTREEFLQLNSKDLRLKEDMDAFFSHTDYAMPGAGTSLQWRHKKKDGSIIYVEIFNYQIIYEGMPVWLGLSIDVTEKTKAEALLKKSYEDIRELASHLQQVREEERAHIAREIHDELGQQLTGLKMDISWLTRRKDIDEKQKTQKIKEILAFIDGTVNTVRRLSAELRPSILDDLGLVEALEWWSNEFEKRAGIPCSFQRPLTPLQVPSNIAIGLFRIYQESLTNVARHANAKKVMAQLETENNQLVLKITDDGKGFDTGNAGQKKTLGLLGMKERTLMMGGSYEIKSQPGKGTTVIIAAPFINQHNLIPQ